MLTFNSTLILLFKHHVDFEDQIVFVVSPEVPGGHIDFFDIQHVHWEADRKTRGDYSLRMHSLSSASWKHDFKV